jgi:hypothetical protein
VLMLKSRLKSAKGSESGLSGGFGVTAPALTVLTTIRHSFIGSNSYHCKRQHLGRPAMI